MAHTTFETDVRVRALRPYFYGGRVYPEDAEFVLKAGDALGKHMELVEAAPAKGKAAKAEAKVETKEEPKTDAKVETKEEPKTDAKVETKADPLK